MIIKLNLGHEVLNEKDILSLISKNIEWKYKEYLSETFNIYSFVKFFTVNTLVVYIVWKLQEKNWLVNVNSAYQNLTNSSKGIFVDILTFINNILPSMEKGRYEWLYYMLIYCFIFSFIYHLLSYLLNLAIRTFNMPFVLPSTIKKDLHFLNQRIESSSDEDTGPGGNVTTSIFGIVLNQKRRRSYPQANVREIEQELSRILDQIDEPKKPKWVKRFIAPPEFIIVFDELDKIDPFTNQETVEKQQEIPEFEHAGNAFLEGATIRKRKQSLLKLLANMKFFISTAKAKFIFIAGRELYDAFLGDVSDREFAVSSIFNEVIYVESFLSSDQKYKDATRMTEEYICKLLFPKNYDKQWEREEKHKGQKFEYSLKEYMIIRKLSYYKFLT